MRDFIFLDCKITADGDCSLEIKRCLLLGRKVMTNLDSILESRDITLPTKVHLVKAMVFSVVMYGCENWTIKKAEHQTIDAFGLWCWRRLLRVPGTPRRSNQSILKEISPEYSLEELMLKLRLQYFGTWWEELTHWKRPWCWERLKAGGEGDDRGWDGLMLSLYGHEFEQALGVDDEQGSLALVHGVTKSWTWLSDWTELMTWAKERVLTWELWILGPTLPLLDFEPGFGPFPFWGSVGHSVKLVCLGRVRASELN